MAIDDVPTVAVPPRAATTTAVPETASFEKRWAAWQAKGAAHDRAVRRKMAVAAPVLIAAAVVMYLLLGRGGSWSVRLRCEFTRLRQQRA
jgi:hypothetical protein